MRGHKPIHFTVAELRMLEIALRLRVEAASESGDLSVAKEWRLIHEKVEDAIKRIVGEEKCITGLGGRRTKHVGPLVVLTRNANRSAFNGYHLTESAYSSVKCMHCGHHWRTKGAFVDALPDATPEQACWLPGQHA